MVEELILPPYQIKIIREKPNFGLSLTEEEQQLVDSTPVSEDNDYILYLKSVHPQRYEKLVRETQIVPISNYRKRYLAAQLVIKAYSEGDLSTMLPSYEYTEFGNAYIKHEICKNLAIYGGLPLSLVFNIAISRYRSFGSLIYSNIALLTSWYFGISTLSLYLDSGFLVIQDKVAAKLKTELFKMQSEQRLVYQYPNFQERFPPDLLYGSNLEFLQYKNYYDQAHKDDFNRTNRNKSTHSVDSSNKHKLIE